MDMEKAALEQIKQHLGEYLASQGIDLTKSHFNCINPEHDDANPSCHIIPDTDLFYCFSCQTCGDIFLAAHYLEGFPITDKLFYYETVVELASRFGVEYNPKELTEPEKEEYTKLRAYFDASNIITHFPEDGVISKHLEERGWTLETARKYGVGGIEKYEDYTTRMESLGWKRDYLNAEGLLRKDIFSRNNLIFTIHDHAGAVVAFAARNMKWTPGSQTPKYINSSSWKRYTKGAMFYNLHQAVKHTPPLYIFEGYSDVITAGQYGLQNCVALGFKTISKEQIWTLSQYNQNKIVICMDGDEPGQDGMEQILHTLLEGSTFDLHLIRMPSKKLCDPDDFIREKGIEEFQRIKRVTPFEWMLEKKTQPMNVDLYEVCNDMIPTIRQEKNLVYRNRLVKILSEHTGVSERDIRRELNRLDNELSYMKDEKLREVRMDAIGRMGRGEDLRFVLMDTLRKTDDIERIFSVTEEDEDEEYLKALQTIRSQCESQDKLIGYNLGRFHILQEKLDGIPKSGCLITFAAKPNTGKSSMMRALSWEIAKQNDDVFCLYMSTDDSRNMMVPPIIALDQNMEIAKVKNPNHRIHDEEDRKKYEAGWKNLTEFMRDRFVIKDSTHGNTLDALQYHISTYRDRFPNKKMVIFLDNFHKLGDFPTTDNLRLKTELCSTRLKNMAVQHDIPIIMTAEFRKIDDRRRPRNEDIKETGKVEYDSDMIWLGHQDLHDNAETQICWTKIVNEERIKAPILEIRVAKNKLGEFKGTLYFRFDPAKNWFAETNLRFMEHMNQMLEDQGKMKRGLNDRLLPDYDFREPRVMEDARIQ